MQAYEPYIALNRFGLGARPGDAKHIANDPRGWLKQQIDRPAPVQRIADRNRAVQDPRKRFVVCLLYTSPSPRDVEESRMPSSA